MSKPIRRVQVHQCECMKCGHIWLPRNSIDRVRNCPSCRTVKWDVARKAK